MQSITIKITHYAPTRKEEDNFFQVDVKRNGAVSAEECNSFDVTESEFDAQGLAIKYVHTLLRELNLLPNNM